ncbi:tape measure protein [Nitratireductor luteus]|uniref:tape measure protein n=1 Tax=Nitratireductor luteus TaxID=2976980 RepID=UPI00223F55A8|nr:tape measure protein [Nitratireductor luteus]
MDDQQQLLVTLVAKMDKYERDMARARQVTGRNFGRMEQRAKQAGDRMERSLRGSAVNIGRVFRNLGLAVAGSATVRGAQRLVDAATRIQNSLKNAGLEGDKLSKVYQRLFASAQKNAAPMGALTDLFSKVSLTQAELNVSTEELLDFADNVATALRVAGTDAQSASGSLLQLSQALGGGVVRAEEFNSILEGTPTIARTVARGLKEAGGSVAQLRKLVVDGKISSEAFFRAFQAGSVTLQQQAENSRITISQAFTRLGNSLIDVAGEFDKSTGASQRFADGITTVADVISNFDVSGFIGEIEAAHNAVVKFLDEIGNSQVFKSIVENLGQMLDVIDEEGNLVNLDAKAAKEEAESLEREVELLQATIEKNSELGFDNTEALARLDEVVAKLAQVRAAMADMPLTQQNHPITGEPLTTEQGAVSFQQGPSSRGGKRRAKVKPVSINDYAPPAGSGSGRKGRSGRGSGENAYEREVEQIRERITAMHAESEARRNATGTYEEQAAAVEQARMKHELLTAAQKAGIAVTPELEAQIDALARSYADASREAQELADKQEDAQQQAEEWANFGGSLASGFLSDLRQGKTASEAFANALGKITDRLIDMVVQMLVVKPLMNMFSGFLGFSGGGLVTGDAPGFARGGYTGHGGKYQPAGVVHRGEYVLNQEATRRIGVPALDTLNSARVPGFAEGGYVGNSPAVRRMHVPANQNAAPVQQISINAPVTVNGSAGTPEQNSELAQKMAKQMETTVRGVVSDEMRKATRPGNFANQRGR